MPKQLYDKLLQDITVEKIEDGLYLSYFRNYYGHQWNSETEQGARIKAQQFLNSLPIVRYEQSQNH